MSFSFRISNFAHKGSVDQEAVYSHHNSCICLFEAETDISFHDQLIKLVNDCDELHIEKLAEFETFIVDRLRQINAPISTSLVCVVMRENKMYIKTVGRGVLFLKRNSQTVKLVHGDSSATGFVKEGDCVAAATQSLINEIGTEGRFITTYFGDDIHKNTHNLSQEFKDKSVSHTSFFIHWSASASQTEDKPFQRKEIIDPNNEATRVSYVANALREFKKNTQGTLTKRRAITLGVVGVIFIIFLWSVGLGYYRHQRNETDKKIGIAKETITQKLQQAEEVSILNSARAQALLNDARTDLKNLKSEVKDDKNSEIITLDKHIQEMEGRILKKEDKSYSEYFDLTVDQKNAKGDLMAYSDGNVAILNKAGGVVYILSLERKSLDKKTASQISSAEDVALADDTAYITKAGVGIYRLEENGKSTKVVSTEKEWGRIADVEFFNSNMYILDGSKSQIYKYVAADDNKYASAGAYFKGGQAPALQDPISMAIDGSVYIISANAALKYTSGLRDGFGPQFPSDSLSFRKILTQEDEAKLYIWDKDHGTIFIVNKEGGYERQIQSSILKTGADVVAHDKKAYVLQGSKLFTIDLN